MSLASENNLYAQKLKSLFSAAPSVGLKAVTKVALQQALLQTHQDSGEAASNWHIAWNGETRRMYVFSKGVGAVGKTGEKRGAEDRRVVLEVVSREVKRIPEDAEAAVLYNPLTDDAHEIHAMIEHAGVSAMDSMALTTAAERAINAHLRRRP